MNAEWFIASLSLAFVALFGWAFQQLPKEQWQMIAAVPLKRTETGEWQGLNLTFYGFFSATSNALAIVMLFILMGAIGVSLASLAAFVSLLLALCWPAARLIASRVENKPNTFTVAGAVFVGVIVSPFLIIMLNQFVAVFWLPVLPTIAAAAIAYAYGESIGRLACVSFGCCYGKRVAELSVRWQRLLEPRSFRFTGATKKAAYAGGLEGVPVVPVQALTAIIYALIALTGTWLFLRGFFQLALVGVMMATQLWRFGSEFLRADERGGGRWTVYQSMTLVMILYVAALTITTKATMPQTNLAAGLASLWNPGVLLFIQLLWLVIFLYTGRSSVTGSRLVFHVMEKQI